jgi:predicted nucleic acid-binding protein
MAVSVYLDASVLVSLFANDTMTARAEAFLRTHPSGLIVSDFVAAEFASAIARKVRIQALTADDARAAFATFDAWTAEKSERVHTVAADVDLATALLRRLDLTLRTPDAINIAITQRIRAELLTFDRQMAADAKTLGTKVTDA